MMICPVCELVYYSREERYLFGKFKFLQIKRVNCQTIGMISHSGFRYNHILYIQDEGHQKHISV